MTPAIPFASPVAIGEIVAGKYRVDRVLGTGAMGVVVAARHVTLDQIVAIKLLGPNRYGSREESIARFLAEARAAARIDSDHVGRVFDVGTLESGVPYMVMEYLEGNDLETELERRGQLAIHEAVDYVLQAADAIAAAHLLGIVHRDLKPANLFLASRPDGSRRVKVLDFGISKGASEARLHEPREAGSFGTPAYMSPEQVRDPARVDGRSDVWALGAILYELVTGQMAFVGPDVHAVLDMVLAEDPCPMDALRRDVPRELEAIVMRALARDRDRRWPSAAALARAIAPFGSGGSLLLRAASGVPSAPPVAMNAGGGGRDATTQPDPEEVRARASIVHDWAVQRARKRIAQNAVLATLSAALLFGAIAIVAWLASPHPAATAIAAAPPEAIADPLPVASASAPVAQVQNTTNQVYSAHGSVPRAAGDRPAGGASPPAR